MLRSLYILLLFVSVTCQYSFAQITGSIFHDIDWNGRQTSNEESFEGVTIKAFGQNNVLLTQGKTDKLGKFNLPLTNNLSIRIEVESPNGFCVTSNNDISFIRSPNNLTVGLGSAAFFDSGKTRFVLPMYFVGNGQQRDNQKDSLDAVFSLLLRADGSYEKESLAKISEVGSVWGVAQAPRTDWIFVTALAKRHVAFGTLGVGGIYAINTKTKQVKPFVDLNRVGVQVGTVSDRGIKGEHRGLYRDSTLFSQVGKIGIGGIDASESAQ